MIRVLVSDDNDIVREGVKQILSDTSDMLLAGEASNTSEAINEIGDNLYDVAVINVSLPDNGLDVLKQIKKNRPDLSVLALSAYPEDQFAARVLRAGADGYLTKSCSKTELLTAIRKVSLGKKYVSQSFAEKIAADLRGDTTDPPHVRLSNREFQVMNFIAAGETLKEIACSMSLSIKTVSTYRSRVLIKMKFKKNSEIIHYAIRYGLIQ